MCETESVKQLKARREQRRKLGGQLLVPFRLDRPKTRADCAKGARPCPWVGCRHHLFTEVRVNGTIAYPYGTEVDALEHMPQSCSLDVAEQGGATWEEVGDAMNCSMQMTRLIETAALAKLSVDAALGEFDE